MWQVQFCSCVSVLAMWGLGIFLSVIFSSRDKILNFRLIWLYYVNIFQYRHLYVYLTSFMFFSALYTIASFFKTRLIILFTYIPLCFNTLPVNSSPYEVYLKGNEYMLAEWSLLLGMWLRKVGLKITYKILFKKEIKTAETERVQGLE